MVNPFKKISEAFSTLQGALTTPRSPTDTSPGKQYSLLRHSAFTIQREEAGILAPSPDRPVWAVLMETGYPHATETLALVIDGTSSVYVSDGGGVIGGHGHETVRKANAEFMQLANRDWRHFQATQANPIPAPGFTIFYARTDAGLLFYGDTQESFIRGHVLSELFRAGQEALTQLHIIVVQDDAEGTKGSTSRDYSKRGDAYAARGDFYRAIAAYNKSIERNPNYYDAYLQRGIAYGALGNFDHALAEFNRAAELNPNDPLLYLNRANVYQFKQQSDLVLAEYGRAMELNPDLAEAYLERGLFYQSSGRSGEAVQDFEHFLAISKDPQKRKFVEDELKKLR